MRINIGGKMDNILSRELNSGKKIPSFGFGTWGLADGAQAEQAVGKALEAGYRLLDTAKIYGNERSVGAAVRDSKVGREEILVTTKLWNGDQGYQTALDAFDASLERLGLEYVDLYLIHWPGRANSNRESWRALGEIYERGDAKSVGVSNFSVEDLEELRGGSQLVPAVNQIPFHPFVYSDQAGVVDYCQERGIVVEAYSPLSRGRHIKHKTISAIARAHNKTNAQVMLRWAIQHGTVPIPKSAHLKRIKENLQVFDFELTDKEMEQLNNLSGHRAGWF
jgi:diketogulonate reductase-like aldo/keto reductase